MICLSFTHRMNEPFEHLQKGMSAVILSQKTKKK